MTIAGIAIGGAIGSVLRYLIQIKCIEWLGVKFPYGTLIVNTIGALLIGFLSVFLLERFFVSTEIRFAIFIGLLGGFTTFSTFSLETLTLIEQGSIMAASINIFLNVAICIGACYLGVYSARIL